MHNHESGATRDPRVPQNPGQDAESPIQQNKREALRNVLATEGAGHGGSAPTCESTAGTHAFDATRYVHGLGQPGQAVPTPPVRSLRKAIAVTREVLMHNAEANARQRHMLEQLEIELRPYNTDTIDHILQLVRALGL